MGDTTYSEVEYGLHNVGKVNEFIQGLMKLETRTPIWPPVEEMLYARKKLNVVLNLDWIVRNVTDTVRPATAISKVPPAAMPKGCVLKRECSDGRRHVFTPKELRKFSVSSLTKKLDECVLDGAEWLSQTFVPDLETMGELRVYLFHGKVSHVIQTSWGNREDLRAKVLNDLWSLEDLRHRSFILFISSLLKSFSDQQHNSFN